MPLSPWAGRFEAYTPDPNPISHAMPGRKLEDSPQAVSLSRMVLPDVDAVMSTQVGGLNLERVSKVYHDIAALSEGPGMDERRLSTPQYPQRLFMTAKPRSSAMRDMCDFDSGETPQRTTVNESNALKRDWATGIWRRPIKANGDPSSGWQAPSLRALPLRNRECLPVL